MIGARTGVASELVLAGEPYGELNWLGRRRIEAAQEVIGLDDEVMA